MISLSESEIREMLSSELADWSYDANYLKREINFKSFVEAFSFMTAVALEAERMGHHPDWSNVYNKVVIKLSTHDSRGVTRLDFELAQKIDQLIRNYE